MSKTLLMNLQRLNSSHNVLFLIVMEFMEGSYKIPVRSIKKTKMWARLRFVQPCSVHNLTRFFKGQIALNLHYQQFFNILAKCSNIYCLNSEYLWTSFYLESVKYTLTIPWKFDTVSNRRTLQVSLEHFKYKYRITDKSIREYKRIMIE